MARTGASVSGVRADVERLSSWQSWMEQCLVGISRLTATAAPLSILQSGDSVDADPTSGFREAAFTGAANGKHTEPHLGVDLRGAVALPNPEKLVSLSACDLCSPEADSLLTAPKPSSETVGVVAWPMHDRHRRIVHVVPGLPLELDGRLRMLHVSPRESLGRAVRLERCPAGSG
jgi:hypothetical protein